MGEVPKLWSWVRLTATEASMPAMAEVLGSMRMWGLQGLALEAASEQLLQAVIEHKQLKEIYFLKSLNISKNWVERIVSKVETINMVGTNFERHDVTNIFIAIKKGTKLKRLDIANNELNSIPPSLIMSATANLEDLNLCQTSLNQQQAEAIFTKISSGESQLRKLNVGRNQLSGVSAATLAKAVGRLEELVISFTSLTRQQVEAIMSTIAADDSRLRRLTIQANFLTSVPPALLARAANRLEAAQMYFTYLSREQVEAVLVASLTSTSLCSLRLGPVAALAPGLVERARRGIPHLHLLHLGAWARLPR